MNYKRLNKCLAITHGSIMISLVSSSHTKLKSKSIQQDSWAEQESGQS
jgi:hypothetical protein